MTAITRSSACYQTSWQQLPHDLGDRWSAWAGDWQSKTGRVPVLFGCLGQAADGIPPTDQRDVDAFGSALPDQRCPVDILLRVRGGNVPATLELCNRLLTRSGSTRCVTIDWATSAGSLLALSSGTVAIGPNDYLGPVLPQLWQSPYADESFGLDQLEAVTLAVEAGRLPSQTLDAASTIDELARIGRSVQWQDEVQRFVHRIATVHGWAAEELARLEEVVLTARRPHDARLFAAELAWAAPSVFRLRSDLETAHLERLCHLLDLRRSPEVPGQHGSGGQHTRPMMICAGPAGASMKIAERVDE